MDKITHFDVFVPKESASMLFHMPIQFTGQSLAVKNLGAVLEQYMETIPVECTLANLPEVLEVDISPLVELGSIIKVKDLSIPENVQFKTADSHSVVASKAPKRVVTVVETPVGGVAEGDADESADSTASSEETASE